MTSDGEALLRAVCENPGDDLPRLVYADWLEEAGRPERAEFIRLQCEAREYVARFPSLPAARTHASDLLRAHRAAWLAELPDLPEVEWGGLWVRGFLDSATVHLGGDPADVLDRVFAAIPLERLMIVGMRGKSLRRVAECPALGRLKTLHLYAAVRSSTANRVIAGLKARHPHLAVSVTAPG